MTARDEEPLLSCHGVCKYFGAMAAVKDLSFEVRRGEIFGIGGPNGAGKTTLFDVISGVVPPDDGKIVFAGQDITRAPPHRVCHLGVARMFQSTVAFDSMTVRDNVLVGAMFGGGTRFMPPIFRSPGAIDRTDAALAAVGLAERAGRNIADLPVFDRKLAMCASAMAGDPKMLLLDEPVGGLNPHEIDLVVRIVRRIAAQGVTVILIEHVMRFMVQLATRVMIMHHGEKIFEGPPDGLARDKTVAEVYLGERSAKLLSKYLARGQ
jgi:branched-chain amino acid transport system ATP-binding protein